MSDITSRTCNDPDAANGNEPLEASPELRRQPAATAWRRAYERKFGEFLFLLRATREEVIVVHHPQVLGDDYDELVESLNRLGDAGKRLVVLPRSERG